MNKRFAFILIIVIAIALGFFISIVNRGITLHSHYFSTQEIYEENSAKELSPIKAFVDELEVKQDFIAISKDIEVSKLLWEKEKKPQIYMENNHFYIFYTYKNFGKKYIDVIVGKAEPLQIKMAYKEEIWKTQSADEKISSDGKVVQVSISSKPSAQTKEKFSNQLELKLNEIKRMRLIYDTQTNTLKYIDNKVKISVSKIDFIAFTRETDVFFSRCITVSANQKASVRLSSIRAIEYQQNEIKYLDTLEENYIKTIKNQDSVIISEAELMFRQAKGIVARFMFNSADMQIPAISISAQFTSNQDKEAEILYQYRFECRY